MLALYQMDRDAIGIDLNTVSRARIAVRYAAADNPDNPEIRALTDVVEQLIASGATDAGP